MKGYHKIVFSILVVLALIGPLAGESLYPELQNVGHRYRFVINADPQMGPRDGHPYEKILYDLLDDFITEVNAFSPAPAFVLFNGDMIAYNKPAYFEAFEGLAKKIKYPVVLVHGNHDGTYPYPDFLQMQKNLCGFSKSYYSFDCGRWHYVLLPTLEPRDSESAAAEMLEWLDRDLKANRDKPTMVFLHFHLLPVGLSQTEYYTYEISFKKKLVDAILKYGNVRQVISGHVHTGIKSSVKTSWTYKGTNFIVAPSPVDPRRFGEEFDDFTEGEDRGYYLIAEVNGPNVTFVGRKTNSPAEYEYPQTFRKFTEEIEPRTFKTIDQLPAHEQLINGNFEDGLAGWHKTYRYRQDKNPTWQAKIVQTGKSAGDKDAQQKNPVKALLEDNEKAVDNKCAYVHTERIGHEWTYEELMEIYQVVTVPGGGTPQFSAKYFVGTENKSHYGGGYFRLHAYSKKGLEFIMFFTWGANEDKTYHTPSVLAYADHGTAFSDRQGHRYYYLEQMTEDNKAFFWRIPDFWHSWHSLDINVEQLYNAAADKFFKDLGINKMMVACGTWTGWTPEAHSGAYFDKIKLNFEPSDAVSKSNNVELKANKYCHIPVYGVWHFNGFDK